MGRKLIRRVEQHDYTVEVLNRRYPVVDMLRASQIVQGIRDHNGYGASDMGATFRIRDGDRVIGYVSYNGRVWAGDPDHREHAVLVYDPNEPARDPNQAPATVTPSRVIRNNSSDSCYVHDEYSDQKCSADPAACRHGGCDGRLCAGDPKAKTRPRYYADTKSFFCDECRALFLKEYRWDDQYGDWVER